MLDYNSGCAYSTYMVMIIHVVDSSFAISAAAVPRPGEKGYFLRWVGDPSPKLYFSFPIVCLVHSEFWRRS